MSHAEQEEWMPVVGFEGAYSVSSFGRVRSEQRTVPNGTRTMIVHQKILHQRRSLAGGYLVVTFSLLGRRQTSTVHTLVLSAFAGPRPVGMLCCHNDGDSANARLSNLRWDTAKSNGADSVMHGTSNRGEKNRASKLTSEQVAAIRSDARTQAAIAREYGVDQSNVSRIKTGDRWAHI